MASQSDDADNSMAMRIVNRNRSPARSVTVSYAEHKWMWAAKGEATAKEFLSLHHKMTCFLCERTFAQCIEERSSLTPAE